MKPVIKHSSEDAHIHCNKPICKPIHKQRGVTLIELVITMVIIGILAAVAAPRFFDYRGDAHKANIERVLASLESAMNIANAQHKLGRNAPNSVMTINGQPIQFFGHYPEANWGNSLRYLLQLDQDISFTTSTNGTVVCTQPLCAVGNFRSNYGLSGEDAGDDGRNVRIWPEGYSEVDQCYAWYHNGSNRTSKRVKWGANTSGC